MGNEKLLEAVSRVREAKAKAEAAGAIARAARDALDGAHAAAIKADNEWHDAEQALLAVARG